MRYVVVSAHVPLPGEPLVISAGERLRWERRPTEWAGWLFCESAPGVRGWAPEAWLTIDGEEAVMVRDYDARELAVGEGDFVDGELVESGWVLARDAAGGRGWVPLACLEKQS